MANNGAASAKARMCFFALRGSKPSWIKNDDKPKAAGAYNFNCFIQKIHCYFYYN